jgi:hypothetical protein
MKLTIIEEAVLAAASDDYESIEIILESLPKAFEEENESVKNVREEDVINAIRALHEKGLVAAYKLSPFPPHATEVSLEEPIESLWFYATKSGISHVTESQKS